MISDTELRSPVRVLVVDDSAFMRTAISRMITSEADFEVVGTASSGAEALAKIPSLNPDIVTLDIQMPGLDGLETLRRIMSQFPRPVIMVSAATDSDADATFSALSCGAFDYVPKQLSATSLDIMHIRNDLVAKIRAATESRRLHSYTSFRKPSRSAVCPTSPASSTIVAIGTSTGGPRALQQILPLLPRDLTVPILIVQHMPQGFTGPFAQRLNSLCSVAVHEAVHNEPLQPGVVYIAPAGLHMSVQRYSDSKVHISLNDEPANQLHMPCVDIMMKSVSETFRHLAMGIILTGMGYDGAEGMRAIHQQGGLTVGQDEASCTVYGMPRACAEQGILTRVVPLLQIPAQILEATRYRKRA